MSRIEAETVICDRKVKVKGDQLLISRNDDDWFRYKRALSYGFNEGDMEELALVDSILAERLLENEEFKDFVDKYFLYGETERLDTWEESEIRYYIEVRTGMRRRMKGDNEEWVG